MSFEDIYDRYRDRISAMLRGTHMPGVSQEVVRQEVCIALNNAVSQGTFPSDTPHQDNYVTSVVVSKTAGFYRAKQRRDRQKQANKTFVLATDITKLALDRLAWDTQRDESWEVLAELLPTLPTKYREIVDMRLQDKSFAEIGGILGISENLANVRHFRAIQKLRESREQQKVHGF